MAKRAGEILEEEEVPEIEETALMATGTCADVGEENPEAKRLLLSPQEMEIFKGIAKGLFYEEIACELDISFSAIHEYQNKMFNDLGVTNQSQAMLLWLEMEAHSLGCLPN